jgi:hypothetical protein
MAGKTKKAVQKAVAKMPTNTAQQKQDKAAAEKLLDKSIGKSGSGQISKAELEKFQNKFGLVTNIVHPQLRKTQSSTGSGVVASSPPPSSNYFYDPFSPLPPPPVRVPERDVVELSTFSPEAETIVNLLFENIGANELTKFVRHDTVEGINPYYDIISNLSDIKRRFDPSSLISSQKSNLSNFDIYPIKLQDKLPDEKYLEENNLLDYVFFAENGDLVIEVVNMSDSEILEVQIDTNGTIYKIEEL